MTAGIANLRGAYLFSLAHLCHLGAHDVNRLTLRDFANYTDNIDRVLAAASTPGGGDT